MRMSRAVSFVMAVLLAVTMSQALVSPSQANAAHTTVAEKGTKKVSIHFAANGGKGFRLYGKIKPRAKKTAILLRASKANGHYARFKSTKTSRSGAYTFSGLKKEGYYAVRVGRTTSEVIHVCKGSCG
jgi:hypothetical protein